MRRDLSRVEYHTSNTTMYGNTEKNQNIMLPIMQKRARIILAGWTYRKILLRPVERQLAKYTVKVVFATIKIKLLPPTLQKALALQVILTRGQIK